MLNGVECIGKHFIVKNKAVGGLCIDVEGSENVVLSTVNGLSTYSIDDLIQLVKN